MTKMKREIISKEEAIPVCGASTKMS